mgnify:CR=1 FL=1
MDSITFSDNNTYLIPNNSNNKYIITFLSEYNIIKSIDNNYITINVNNITPLTNINKIKKQIKKYKLKITRLKQHNDLYYNKDNPKISDAAYDDLKNEIYEFEKKFLYLIEKHKNKTHLKRTSQQK